VLSGYVPAAGVAAATALTGRLPRIGAAATAGAALFGPAVAAYTAALLSDTAVPAWHDGYPELPFVFTGSGAMAAGGLCLLAAPAGESAPARHLALLGQVMEMTAFERMTRRIGMIAEPYHAGRAGTYVRIGQVLGALGATGAALSGTRALPAGQPRRILAGLSGAALIGASLATRWGIFHAGLASAKDPKYTVVPQRRRLAERQTWTGDGRGRGAEGDVRGVRPCSRGGVIGSALQMGGWLAPNRAGKQGNEEPRKNAFAAAHGEPPTPANLASYMPATVDPPPEF